MEPEEHTLISQEVKKSQNRTLWQFTIALFVMVPSLIFWGVVGIVLVIFVASYTDEDAMCNVARIPVQGILMTTGSGLDQIFGLNTIVSADSVIESIELAEEDDTIEAILLDIDSPGGTPASADEILSKLKTTTKPTVAVIRDLGTSAAYWVAVGTDHIVASPVSEVGSIGVTMSYLESASSTEMDGSRWIDLSSGLFKDAGNPERTLSEGEELYFQSQVDTVHEYMLDRIAEARPEIRREELEVLADGRAYLGADALPLKLIDELGGFAEALKYLATSLSKNEDDMVLCPVQGGGLEELLY
jgi:protease IV